MMSSFSFHNLILQYGFWGIIAGSLLLEDATLAASFLLLGTLSFSTLFWGNLIGICAGDIWLYILGFYSHYLSKFYFFRFLNKLEDKFNFENRPESNMLFGVTIFMTRFVPGTRVLTYAASGFLRFPLIRFIVLSVLSTLIWVYLTLQIGLQVQDWISAHVFWSLGLFVLFLIAIRQLVKRFAAELV